MSNQLRFGYIGKYNKEVEFRLSGATIVLYSENNYELFNFLYFNKVFTTFDNIRGILCSIADVVRLMSLIDNLICYDKTSSVFLDLVTNAESQEFPVVVEKINPKDYSVRYYLAGELEESLVDANILSCLKIANIPFSTQESDGIAQLKVKASGYFNVDNVLVLKPSDPLKINELGLNVCWKISELEFGYPALLYSEIKDLNYIKVSNSNFFSNISLEALESQSANYLLKTLRRVVLESKMNDTSYMTSALEYTSANFDAALIVSTDNKKWLWEGLLDGVQNVTLVTLDEIKSISISDFGIIVFDDINPVKINNYIRNNFITDLDLNVIYLVKTQNSIKDNYYYEILSIIKPTEFDSSVPLEARYTNGKNMFIKHKELYTFDLFETDKSGISLVYFRQTKNDDKITYGPSVYSNKFSVLVNLIKNLDSVSIVGLGDMSELRTIYPKKEILKSLDGSENTKKILYEHLELSGLLDLSFFDIVFVEDN